LRAVEWWEDSAGLVARALSRVSRPRGVGAAARCALRACSHGAAVAQQWRGTYRTSNGLYGWEAPREVKPAREITVARSKQGLSEDDRRLNELFWRPTNQEYGAFGFQKNSLCEIVEDLHTVNRARHVLAPHAPPAKPAAMQHRTVTVAFDNYDIEAVKKVEHKIYTTTSNEIGAKKPPFEHTLHPVTNDFSKTFLAGASRDCSLNTTVTKNRYLD
jgi:hypothetical protein